MSEIMMDKFKDIVYKAGEMILHADHICIAKEKEEPANFVTKYDTMVQEFLIQEFKKLLPEAAFLGEEDGQCASPADEAYCFIIDPIDGTTNFICNFQYSAISVALACHGELTHGIVYNPFRREMFWAEKGKGAFLNDQPLTPQDRPLSDGVVIFGTTPYNLELRDSAFSLAKEISYLTMDLRELGSAALSLCYVAANRAAAYASPRLCTWDYAAAAVLLAEVSYPLSDFDGNPLNFRTKTPVVASTPTGFAQFVSISKNYSEDFK